MSHRDAKFIGELLVLLLTIGILACLTDRVAFGAGQEQKSSGITNIEATAVIALEVEVHAADKPIAIPCCGEDEGEYFFCNGEAYLEVLRRGAWVPAKPRKELTAVMGAEPGKAQKRLLVEPQKTVYFVFNFDKAFFGIQKDERLRMQINAWNGTEAIGNRDARVTISSPEVECP